MFILAVLAFVATSCTPESIEGNEQQIDKEDYEIPDNG